MHPLVRNFSLKQNFKHFNLTCDKMICLGALTQKYSQNKPFQLISLHWFNSTLSTRDPLDIHTPVRTRAALCAKRKKKPSLSYPDGVMIHFYKYEAWKLHWFALNFLGFIPIWLFCQNWGYIKVQIMHNFWKIMALLLAHLWNAHFIAIRDIAIINTHCLVM